MENQTITQTINIIVGGEGSSSLASTGISLSLVLTVAFALIVSGVVAWRFLARRSHALNFRNLGVLSFFALAVAGLVFSLSGASAAPTLTLGTDQNNLTVTVPEGGGAASTTTTVTTGTANSTGYTLTSALSEAEPGIAIKLKGGNISTSTALNAGDPALTLKSTEEASSNDATEVTLEFTIDGTVTAGKKDLKLSYVVVDNEPPVPTTMQSMTSDYCQNHMTIYDGSNEEAVLTLSDPRGDGQTYQVAKLADENCWMLTNLKLGSTTGTTLLTSADSNVNSDFTLPQVVTTGTASYDNPGVYGPVTGDTGDGATNYGYLYNWSSTTAGESRTTMPEGSGNALYSICPANWRLPTGGASGEFSALYTALGNDRTKWNYPGPFKATFAGLWWGGFGDQGGRGDLWSSSAHPVYAAAFSASFFPGGVLPGSAVDRVSGVGVRCLLN